MKKLSVICIFTLVIGIAAVGPIGAQCVCSITPNPATVFFEFDRTVTEQFYVAPSQECDVPSYIWSDDCTLGGVDQNGLFTVPPTTRSETCQICVTDTANTYSGGIPVVCCAEVTMVEALHDIDGDGVIDCCDNCKFAPNGAYGGTCIAGVMGQPCMSNGDCGTGGVCSMNQEDTDNDYLGDVCDNCPDHPNGPGSGICTAGDIGQTCAGNADCNCGGMCKNFVCIGPCPVTYGQPCFGPYDCNVTGVCYQDNQLDSYPPQSNSIGDACDCEGNFDCDSDNDGSDAATFKADFGRSTFDRPCIAGDTCNGDFSCDGDVDGTDAALFKQDFGRSQFQNPCPACTVGVEWCVFP